MTTVTKVFLQPKYAEAAQTTQYTSPVNTVIDKITATNVSASNQLIKVSLVQAGQSAVTAPLTVAVTLAAGKTYHFPEMVGHYLGVNDYISTLAGAASSVALRISGRELT
jgi:hypothetical protein